MIQFFYLLSRMDNAKLIDLCLLSMIGILGGLANLWLTQSYKFSEVSLVTPLKYLGLVFAIIFGYFIWNEIPNQNINGRFSSNYFIFYNFQKRNVFK